jgi:hypothetical protein
VLDHKYGEAAQDDPDPEDVCKQVRAEKLLGVKKGPERAKRERNDADDERSLAQAVKFGRRYG